MTRLRRWLQSWAATIEVLLDREAMADLRAAELDADEGRLRDYDDVRRELGLASNQESRSE